MPDRLDGAHYADAVSVEAAGRIARALRGEREPLVPPECLSSPDGRHQVDTSMESGPCNCFHCGESMR